MDQFTIDRFTQLYWIRRLGSTRRFHGANRLTHDETVFHHSASVAMILIQTFPDEVSVELLKAAMMHDLEEGITGDIPAPVKWILRTSNEFNAFGELESKVRDYYDISFPCLKAHEVAMLKAADFIDATFTCLMERSKGNREMDWPFDNYSNFINKQNILEQFPALEHIWQCIKNAYGELRYNTYPETMINAERANFWEVIG